MVLVKVLAPAYFARQDTLTPFRIGAVAVAVNIVVNLSVYQWFGHVGLALATAVAAFVNAYLLARGLLIGPEGQGVFQLERQMLLRLARVAVAAALMGVGLALYTPAEDYWLTAGSGMRVASLVAVVAAGGFSFALVLVLLGLRPRHLRHQV